MDPAAMDQIVTLVFGGLVGWVASVLMKSNALIGIVTRVVVGIAGSFAGVFVATALGVRSHSTPVSWIFAILGAALLLALLRGLSALGRVAPVR